MRPLRILTWHVHGSYLLSLASIRHELYLPVMPGRPHGYGGRSGPFPWPDSVHEVPADRVSELELDVVLYQAAPHYLEDQYRLLSTRQRQLPRIFLEHDPPRAHPTDTRHVVADDPETLLVHVTAFNALMWDAGRARARVVEHGVPEPTGGQWTGELPRGIVVINNLRSRGRRLGADIFERARAEVPLDLVGMGAEELGGLGEVPHRDLTRVTARYRFFFNPIRYTSLGLAVCEAMMLGMPIVGLATSEMATVVQNGVTGYVDTSPEQLIQPMRRLLEDPEHAGALGAAAREYARERFNLERFARDWDMVLEEALSMRGAPRLASIPGTSRSAGGHA